MVLRNVIWGSRNLAERLTFSSFSTSIDDSWGADIERPYRIVVRPGYRVPSRLDRRSKDSLWVDGPLERETVVWDGFCPIALHEVIAECFDPFSESDCIVVVDKTGQVCRDDRPGRIMAVRPKRVDYLSRRACENQVADLYAWALLFSGNDVPSGSGRACHEIYADIYAGNSAGYGLSRDARARFQALSSGGYLIPGARMPYGKPREISYLSRGPLPSSQWDRSEADSAYDMGAPARYYLSQAKLTISDLEKGGGSPYEIAMAKALPGAATVVMECSSPVPKEIPARSTSRPEMENLPIKRMTILQRIFGRKDDGKNPF